MKKKKKKKKIHSNTHRTQQELIQWDLHEKKQNTKENKQECNKNQDATTTKILVVKEITQQHQQSVDSVDNSNKEKQEKDEEKKEKEILNFNQDEKEKENIKGELGKYFRHYNLLLEELPKQIEKNPESLSLWFLDSLNFAFCCDQDKISHQNQKILNYIEIAKKIIIKKFNSPQEKEAIQIKNKRKTKDTSLFLLNKRVKRKKFQKLNMTPK